MSLGRVVVVGFIGKLPYAGMSLFNLHYITGLRQLGYEVHYVERQDSPEECYDPARDRMTDDPEYAVAYLHTLLPRYGFSSEKCFSLIDRQNRCHGSGWKILMEALNQADFVLTLASPTWFDELERCPRRAFIDGDPMFTQVAMLRGDEPAGTAPRHYNTLFTYGVRVGKPDCTLPAVGCRWIPTRPVVATSLWSVSAAPDKSPVRALMHWAAGSDVSHNGRIYGHKNREFERFIDLPRRTTQTFELAVGGRAPRDRLREHGWKFISPLEATGTIDRYKEFIAESRADFGIAKHAYVASRCGWFSDRSTCYLASGRPVLHQETGFTDWLPAGEGVLAFSDASDVLECIKCLDMDYERHSRAARKIAEEHFEAATVVARMLDDAGYR